jgi:hypothetical protein
MHAPAERMEIPSDHDTVTYANGDLTDSIKLFWPDPQKGDVT